MGRLDNKVAVITGAASGIGLATAVRFAGEGAAIVIGDLNRKAAKPQCANARKMAATRFSRRCDVQTESEIKALIDRAVKRIRQTRHHL